MASVLNLTAQKLTILNVTKLEDHTSHTLSRIPSTKLPRNRKCLFQAVQVSLIASISWMTSHVNKSDSSYENKQQWPPLNLYAHYMIPFETKQFFSLAAGLGRDTSAFHSQWDIFEWNGTDTTEYNSKLVAAQHPIEIIFCRWVVMKAF